MSISKIFIPVASMCLVTSVFLAQAFAAESEPLLEKNMFSIGVGISDNEINNPSDDETGFQFLAAYDLSQINLMEGVNSSVEFGFMDFGFSKDDTGIWASYVVDGPISGQFGWLAQAGFDIGDDSGLMLGAGVKYAINEKIDLRAEYVVRDDVDSLQFNILYHL